MLQSKSRLQSHFRSNSDVFFTSIVLSLGSKALCWQCHSLNCSILAVKSTHMPCLATLASNNPLVSIMLASRIDVTSVASVALIDSVDPADSVALINLIDSRGIPSAGSIDFVGYIQPERRVDGRCRDTERISVFNEVIAQFLL
jgi:hypothetical protein